MTDEDQKPCAPFVEYMSWRYWVRCHECAGEHLPSYVSSHATRAQAAEACKKHRNAGGAR